MKITKSNVLTASWIMWAISLSFALAGFFFDHNTGIYRVLDTGWWISSFCSLALMVYAYKGRFE